MGAEAALVMTIVSAVTSVVSLAISLSMDTSAKDSGISINRKGDDNPKIVAFGNCRVPAIRVWNNVNNNSTRNLVQAYSLGIGPLKSVDTIYIDDVVALDGVIANQWYDRKSSSEFPNASMGVRLGKPTEQVYPNLVTHGDGEWTEDHRGDRIASISMNVYREVPDGDDNNIRIVSDTLKVEALVKGNAVIDPRLDPSLLGALNPDKRTYDSYRNPSCVILTYIMDTYFGMGLPSESINIKSFIDLANYCDANHITFDGYIDQDSTYGNILLDLATSFNGNIYLQDGEIFVKPDRQSASVCHIEQDDLVGTFKLSNASDSDYYNIVNVEYANTKTDYAEDKYVLPADVTEIHSRDGFEKVNDISMPYTAEEDGNHFVKKVANLYLKKANYQKTIEFELDNTKHALNINDVFEISNPDYKLDRVKFRVSKVTSTLDDQTMVSQIVAVEYHDFFYDESDYEDGNSSSPTTPPTFEVVDPVNLKFNQTGFITTGTGDLTWTTRYGKEHRTLIEYKLHSADSWTRLGEFYSEKYTIVGLKADRYDFRICTMAYNGAASNWVKLENVLITSTVSMPTVTNLKANFSTENAIIEWDDMCKLHINDDTLETFGEIFSHYEIQVYKDNNLVNTYRETTNKFAYTYDLNIADGLSRSVVFKVRMFAKDGTSSEYNQIGAVNPQCGQPSGISAKGTLTDVAIVWDMETSSDYVGTEIHISQHRHFNPSQSSLVHVSSGAAYVVPFTEKGIYYVKLGHYDKFGSDLIAYSDAVQFTQKSIDDVLTNAPAWGQLEDDINDSVGDIIDTTIGNKVEDAVADAIDKLDPDSIIADVLENATEINKLKTEIATTNSNISSVATVVDSLEGTVAVLENTMQSNFEDSNAAISNNAKTIATNTTAITTLDNRLTAKVGKNTADIINNAQAIVDNTQAIVALKEEIKVDFEDSNAVISENKTAIADTNKAVVSLDNRLTAKVNQNTADIITNSSAIVDNTSAILQVKSDMTAKFEDVEAGISENKQAIADNTTSIAATEIRLNSKIEDTNANLVNNYYTKTQTNGQITTSIAASENKMSVANDEKFATISNLNKVEIDVNGKVSALTQIKHDVNGKISGLVMGNDGETSHFDIMADKFRVSTAAGSQSVFEVDTVSNEVKMKSALIGKLGAENIEAGTINGNHISATSKLIIGNGNETTIIDGTSNTIKLAVGSSNASVAPFRVDKNGKFFSTNAEVTGKITATSGNIGNAVIENGLLKVPAAQVTGKLTAAQIETDTLVLQGQTIAPKRTIAASNTTINATYKRIASGSITLPIRNIKTRLFINWFFLPNKRSLKSTRNINVQVRVNGTTIKTIGYKSLFLSSSRFSSGDSGTTTVDYYAYPSIITGMTSMTPTSDVCNVELWVQETGGVSPVAENITLTIEGSQAE